MGQGARIKFGINLLKGKVLVLAILLSAAWHLFWLSAFTVVVVPKVNKSVKFSNVSFLGPILERSVLNVSPSTQERTALEQKFLMSIDARSAIVGERAAGDEYVLSGFDAELFESDKEFITLTAARVDSDKIEP
ncbi:MAG: hypothetical protein Q8R38_02020 [Candidatus Omnitrophota bacterium]|nr:hypothetical protein [Candidatus Omnitrophota bacterium]